MVSLLLGVLLCLVARDAHGQTDDPAYRLNADLQRIRPPTTHYGFLTTESARTLGRRSFELGGAFSYTRDPLSYGSTSSEYLLRHMAEGDLTLTFGLADGLDISLVVPTKILKGINHTDTSITDATDPDACLGHVTDQSNLEACDFVPALYEAPGALQLGDLRLHLRFGAELNEKHHLAFLPSLSLNTGNASTLAGSGDVILEAGIAYQFVSDRFGAGANLAFRYYGGEQPALGVLSLGQEVILRIGGSYTVVPLCLDLMVDVVGSTVVIPLSLSADRTPVEGLAGVRIRPAKRMTVTLGLGKGLTTGYGASQARGFASATWEWGAQPTTFLASTRPNYPECCHSTSTRLVIEPPTGLNATRGQAAQDPGPKDYDGKRSIPEGVDAPPHSVRVLVRRVLPGAFYSETYEQLVDLAARPDDSVLAVTDVFPQGLSEEGTGEVRLDFEWPASGHVGVYALYLEASDDTVWRVRLEGGAQPDGADPVPRKMVLQLGETGIEVVRSYRGLFGSEEVH